MRPRAFVASEVSLGGSDGLGRHLDRGCVSHSPEDVQVARTHRGLARPSGLAVWVALQGPASSSARGILEPCVRQGHYGWRSSPMKKPGMGILVSCIFLHRHTASPLKLRVNLWRSLMSRVLEALGHDASCSCSILLVFLCIPSQPWCASGAHLLPPSAD